MNMEVTFQISNWQFLQKKINNEMCQKFNNFNYITNITVTTEQSDWNLKILINM